MTEALIIVGSLAFSALVVVAYCVWAILELDTRQRVQTKQLIDRVFAAEGKFDAVAVLRGEEDPQTGTVNYSEDTEHSARYG